MDQDIHFSARMLMLAGWLMACSGTLMMGCGRPEIGVLEWAAAACMCLTAWHVRLVGDKMKKAEELKHEEADEIEQQ